MVRYILYGFICLFLAGCLKEQSSQMVSQAPRAKWQSLKLHDYTIDQVRSCFCPNSGVVVRITVRSDTIAGIIRVTDGSTISSRWYRTVDSLFALIENLKNDSLVIRYNEQYGYPEYLDVNPQLHPVDGGYLYETSNLRIP